MIFARYNAVVKLLLIVQYQNNDKNNLEIDIKYLLLYVTIMFVLYEKIVVSETAQMFLLLS